MATIRNGAEPSAQLPRNGELLTGMRHPAFLAFSQAATAPVHAPISRHAFELLAQELGIQLASVSLVTLHGIRDAFRMPDPRCPRSAQLTDQQRDLLCVGLTLELLQQPRVWNEGAGDLVPFIVDSANWPEGRALRIVDTDNGAIHLYRPGQPEAHHYPGREVLPEVEDDEIILLRHDRHFSLLRRDQDGVVDEVAADGDCFFSCLSKALGSPDIATSNLALRQQLAEHLWTRQDALQLLSAVEGPLTEQRAIGSVAPDVYRFENGDLLATDVYSPQALSSIQQQTVNDLGESVAGMLDAVDTTLQHRIQAALRTARKHYSDRIEQVLTDNPAGLDEADLFAKGAEIKHGVINEMLDTLAGFSANESLDKHEQCITADINAYWNIIRAANAANLTLRESARPHRESLRL
ncbi:hypothetical protein H9654_16820 [Stenotrophomonas sp. Sa5BUN4]|uniref:OTU domain-containing protein n=1 Tax=Stenotrophomonas lacuserhaii TaxID=2760084 RepID=A0A8X8FZT8_9GAMM|nr:OTU domain-containing protein [Stenotrophomonas pennii]MBD7955857.1 hypothetical protein [Stenotrophomonas pennii]